MENADSKVTVIIPALNEEKGIECTLLELLDVLDNPLLLVIDGNSSDKTVKIAKSMNSKVVMQTKKGKGQAISESLAYIHPRTKYVVFIDADFTYPAKFIPQMIQILEENPDVGMVNGNRFETRFVLAEVMNNVFYLGNRFLAFIQYIVNGVKLRDPLTGLRVIRSEILNEWTPKSKGFDIEVEMNYLVERKGFRIIEHPIRYRPRVGEKKLNPIDGIAILKRIIINAWQAI